MTGYQSKKAAARDKLIELAKEGMGMHSPDAPEYIVCEALIEALAHLPQESVVERAWFTIDELNAWADKKLAENPHWVMPAEEPERKEALAQQEPVIWERPVYQPPRMETPRPGADDHLNIKRRGV